MYSRRNRLTPTQRLVLFELRTQQLTYAQLGILTGASRHTLLQVVQDLVKQRLVKPVSQQGRFTVWGTSQPHGAAQ